MSLFSIVDCTTKITIEKMRQLLKLVNKQTRFSKRDNDFKLCNNMCLINSNANGPGQDIM